MGQESHFAVSCGVGHRCGSDPALLWLWCRPAAVAPIQPIAWEPPYAIGAALKKQTKKECGITQMSFQVESQGIVGIVLGPQQSLLHNGNSLIMSIL